MRWSKSKHQLPSLVSKRSFVCMRRFSESEKSRSKRNRLGRQRSRRACRARRRKRLHSRKMSVRIQKSKNLRTIKSNQLINQSQLSKFRKRTSRNLRKRLPRMQYRQRRIKLLILMKKQISLPKKLRRRNLKLA